jgi:hypothetical protein
VPHAHPEPTAFQLLVGGLAGQAQVGLGLREDPITHQTAKDLANARQAIDLLAMLEAKTKGNLTPDEARLLGAVLADLRMAYVRAT